MVFGKESFVLRSLTIRDILILDYSINNITTDTDAVDRYEVSIDLQNIVTFLDCTKYITITERSVFYFLLTFPYYEHEWDIAGFILSSIYDDDVDNVDDNVDEAEDDNDEEVDDNEDEREESV